MSGLLRVTPLLKQSVRYSSPVAALGRKVFTQPMTPLERYGPIGAVVLIIVLTFTKRKNVPTRYGNEWIGGIYRTTLGRHLGYRRPIADQIRASKQKDLAEHKDWPWRIWVS